MNIKSFVTIEDFEKIRSAVQRKAEFEHKREMNSEGTSWTMALHSSVVNEKTAKEIWNGNCYLIHFDLEYRGKLGIGGRGFAVDNYKLFDSWDVFKKWIDKQCGGIGGYEVVEYGQLSLF